MELPLEVKASLDSIKGSFEELRAGLRAVQAQADAIDARGAERHAGGVQTKSVAEELFDMDDFKRFAENPRGAFQTKVAGIFKKAATGSDFLYPASAVSFSADRQAGIAPIAFRRLFLRDALRNAPATGSHVDFVKIASFSNQASPQVEASAKGESSFTYEVISEKVRTLAHWTAASRQVLSDVAALSDSINLHLLYALRLVEERQILSGSGSGEDYDGLITQAQAFNTALLGTGARTFIDCLARGIEQVEMNDFQATGIVVSVQDFWSLALQKDSTGRYILGDPSAGTRPMLWGRDVIPSNEMAAGTFLIGDFLRGATLHSREEALVEISTQHSDFFVKNLVAIRAELRACLTVPRAEAWVYGSLTTSPA